MYGNSKERKTIVTVNNLLYNNYIKVIIAAVNALMHGLCEIGQRGFVYLFVCFYLRKVGLGLLRVDWKGFLVK